MVTMSQIRGFRSLLLGWFLISLTNIGWALTPSFQGLGDLSGGDFYSCAHAVSADGSVIVGRSKSDNGSKAFRWENETMTGLGYLPGYFSSIAHSVSADGSTIVGINRLPEDEAFIWDETNGIQNLRDILINNFNLELSGWKLNEATGISDDGLTIVGYGVNPNGQAEGWIATVPEPTTFTLFALASFALTRKRRL
jgi:probable HAF family extracellular repeat protein